jgi:peptidoglycan hydrolase CwlO-like protein
MTDKDEIAKLKADLKRTGEKLAWRNKQLDEAMKKLEAREWESKELRDNEQRREAAASWGNIRSDRLHWEEV